MSDMTAAQRKAERIRVLGREMGAIYDRLWNELVWVHREWKEFLALFSQPQDRIDALNEAAGAFFFLVQHALGGHVISSIANLTDQPETRRKQSHLTVRRLPTLAGAKNPAFGRELRRLIKKGEASWEPITERRHKLLAHLDLDVALERQAAPLRKVGKREIDAALSALDDVFNAVEKRCSPGADVRYDVAVRYGGADALLHALQRAKRAEDERMERIRTERVIPEDLK